MSTEDEIFAIYQQLGFHKGKPQINRRMASRNSDYSPSARWQFPSFRSQYFNVGNGLTSVAAGSTVTLAQKVVPAQHSGILTGFSQFFSNCDCSEPDVINSIVWGLRINGERVREFPDFTGEFSQLYQPCEVFFPLLGEANGNVSVSPGGSPVPDIPTVSLLVTNNNTFSVVLQGRLIGYSFPVEELFDEFSAY